MNPKIIPEEWGDNLVVNMCMQGKLREIQHDNTSDRWNHTTITCAKSKNNKNNTKIPENMVDRVHNMWEEDEIQPHNTTIAR